MTEVYAEEIEDFFLNKINLEIFRATIFGSSRLHTFTYIITTMKIYTKFKNNTCYRVLINKIEG